VLSDLISFLLQYGEISCNVTMSCSPGNKKFTNSLNRSGAFASNEKTGTPNTVSVMSATLIVMILIMI
jgi:hypothetical protein